MLKSLTHKLKNHTLREALRNLHEPCEEDRDSGTESDEEHTKDNTEYRMDSKLKVERRTVKANEGRREGKGREEEEDSALDSALPSDSDLTADQHSSEEELEVINGNSPCREKRKWCQVTRSSGVSRGDSSCSSDDELHVLSATPTPLQFRSSPPADAHRPGSQSPPAKLFHPSSQGTQGSSPRKRHRHAPRAHHIQRPCLDFEKMQQLKTRAVTTWRHGGELSLYCW